MYDIVVAHRDEGVLLEMYELLQQSLSHAGLVINPEKVRRHLLFQYLGHIKKLSLKTYKAGRMV